MALRRALLAGGAALSAPRAPALAEDLDDLSPPTPEEEEKERLRRQEEEKQKVARKLALQQAAKAPRWSKRDKTWEIGVWTGRFKGSVDLLQLLMRELSREAGCGDDGAGEGGWAEVTNADARALRACKVVWLGKCADQSRWGGLHDYEGLSDHHVVSKLEVLKELADKAETERALARCRRAGMPGFGPGAGAPFPRCWVLPAQRAELEAWLRARRKAARAGGGRRRP